MEFYSWVKLRASQATLAISLATLGVMAAHAAPPSPSPIDPDVSTSFHTLITHIEEETTILLNRGQRRSLLSKLENAESKYSKGKVCAAANLMHAYENETQAMRKQAKSVDELALAEDLYARGRMLGASFFDIFFDLNLDPPTCFGNLPAKRPLVIVEESDNKHFAASVQFGSLALWGVDDGGEFWTQIRLPGLENLIGAPGRPAIPSWQTLVAVPTGAAAQVSTHYRVRESISLNLYPYQVQPLDGAEDEPFPPPIETFTNPPFEKVEAAYQTDAFLPSEPCAFLLLGQYRDVQIGQIQCVAGQYNAVTDEFRLFDSVDFDLTFDGGEETFINTQTLSPFEPASANAVAAVINSATVIDFAASVDISALSCMGEELLILTHPDFRNAANDLAQWKRDKGIVTNVLNVGSGVANYDTADEIDDLIEHHYDDCRVRPSYILLLGDSEFIPPSATNYNVDDDSTTGSDYGYAVYPQFIFDIFPDFAVARMPVDTAAEAQQVVNKVIEYESHPPLLNTDEFYSTATFASYFQCCRSGGLAGRSMRSFIETTELGVNKLKALGYTAERIYTTDTAYRSAPVTDPTPRRYYDGSALPAQLSGINFLWDGDTNDVINAFNDGRFLMVHRDHGSSSGWVDPAFSTSDLSSLNNGKLLPVLYSVNCKSGYWDRETDTSNDNATESFMEDILMLADGGIVGGLGDVRNSPSWANSALTRGFLDATWPSLLPDFGQASSLRRLGDTLNHGKIYLLSEIGVAQPAGSITLEASVDELIMWHAFGDPTLEMWTSNPYSNILSGFFVLEVLPEHLRVQYGTNGALITAYQINGEGSMLPVGRGEVESGVAELTYFVPPESTQPILLSANLPGAVSVLLNPGGEPGQPDLIIEEIRLGGSSNVMQGEQLRDRLALLTSNLGNVPAQGNRLGQRGYSIDMVLSTNEVVPEGFAHFPAGDDFFEDYLLPGGRVSNTPDIAAGTSVVLTASSGYLGVSGEIPSNTRPGDYFLCARIDPGEVVAEALETNNLTCTQVTVKAKVTVTAAP